MYLRIRIKYSIERFTMTLEFSYIYDKEEKITKKKKKKVNNM